MNGFGILLLFVAVGLPVAWLMAEFKAGRPLRIGLGVAAIGTTLLCTYGLTSLVTNFNYNARFGGATGNLIRTSISQIEDGHLDRVLKAWRGLDAQYRPTYENSAGYKDLVEGATAAMKEETLPPAGLERDDQPFGPKTWIGHWENDTGFWIVINDIGKPFDVVRSGSSGSKLHSVSVSSDHGVVKFKEGDDWLHTLTLKNKYEVSHDWFDLKNQKPWKSDSLHKLRRATESEKAMTQRGSNAQ